MSLRIYGNRLLKTLPNQHTRPTSARVRQAVFNIWQGTIIGCRWLDLCAGSGSMGAEALCRGASLVIGIEKSIHACEIVQENWQKVANHDQQFQILRGNIAQQINKLIGQKFDKIYFDPPYASDLYVPILQAIAQNELLDIEGEIGVEHSHQNWIAPEIANLEVCRQKVYGNTGITFYKNNQ
ncbi:16S rRNA (guanine(966)-N(2))-methyltransferase RsmD [Anabaena sp. FACHB-1237]|uniref:16S rRNA (guanine(966)-N(2))-methyltransferase RsmD n=1 Tax=Anabaena sp. FACHB-1237 TaxID=2692769 RepID=UPI0016807FE7|nr:16S rRNA (guanine(966)-N(2))-methyltransferase RsmD [Anabaena sp. FACHB-1237]MBD2136538.1 16S rRNA (guanine(966)-N(2))-methyltransferase RsmD [Anabaena sp. FACHB-1237]